MCARNRDSDEYRPKHSARLIHRRMQTESPTVANYVGRFGKQNVDGRSAQTFAGALSDDQQRCRLPIPGKREKRHCDEIQKISEDRNRPVSACSIDELARKQAQARGDHFAQPRDETNLRCGRAEALKERPDNAARAFISHIGEQADYAKGDDETKCRFALARSHGNLLASKSNAVLRLLVVDRQASLISSACL